MNRDEGQYNENFEIQCIVTCVKYAVIGVTLCHSSIKRTSNTFHIECMTGISHTLVSRLAMHMRTPYFQQFSALRDII